jgi:hypothetical protein
VRVPAMLLSILAKNSFGTRSTLRPNLFIPIINQFQPQCRCRTNNFHCTKADCYW